MQKIQIQTMHGQRMPNCPKISILSPQISHLSSNRRVQNLAFYFQFTNPARKLTHRMKFEHVWMQKDTNFGNAIILRYFRPEKMPKIRPRKTRILLRTALIDPSKNANKIRKVFIFFPEFRTLFEMHSLTPSTLTNQPHWEHLIAHFLQIADQL